jgi:hypothetical protein
LNSSTNFNNFLTKIFHFVCTVISNYNWMIFFSISIFGLTPLLLHYTWLRWKSKVFFSFIANRIRKLSKYNWFFFQLHLQGQIVLPVSWSFAISGCHRVNVNKQHSITMSCSFKNKRIGDYSKCTLSTLLVTDLR